MELAKTGKVDKEWGYEIIWASNGFYCGKILVFNKAGSKTTLSISKNKKKSWFVQAGRFKIEFIDIQTGNTQTAILEEGKTVDIAEMSPHSLESLAPNSMIFEVGTPDDLRDNFRLSPDDTQKSSEELK